MQIANHTTESTQERSHSSVSSVVSALDTVAILDVTLGYTLEINRLGCTLTQVCTEVFGVLAIFR